MLAVAVYRPVRMRNYSLSCCAHLSLHWWQQGKESWCNQCGSSRSHSYASGHPHHIYSENVR